MDIHINALLIIILIFGLTRVLHAHRVGLTGEVKTVVNLFMSLIIFTLLIFLFVAVSSNNQLRIILTGLLLFAATYLFRILKTVLKPVELIAELPLMDTLDQLLGIAAGLAETLFVIWALSVLIYNFELGDFGAWMRNQINESLVLTFLFKNNMPGMVITFIYTFASKYINI